MKLVLDTNVIIDFLKQTPDAVDPLALIEEHECFVSVITKLELLKYPGITTAEEEKILNILQIVPVMPMNTAIENETIAISRATKLKLPDAIIGATAIVYDAEVVSSDPHFFKCPYPALRILKTS
ncbi:MAG: type II toxin-antitoxin system VapC family toxin [Treponema sp.]|jgi:predicted nucleic acid-binding protein|nr:type II toxin-antitoxin system VapC family toxin [Treponema sp.]